MPKRDKTKCQLCGEKYLTCIYMGLPVRVCPDDRCSCAEGPGVFLMERIPDFFGEGGWHLFRYQGSYWRGLFDWIRYKPDRS